MNLNLELASFNFNRKALNIVPFAILLPQCHKGLIRDQYKVFILNYALVQRNVKRRPVQVFNVLLCLLQVY